MVRHCHVVTLGVTVVLSRAGLLGRRNRNIAGFAFVIAAASLLMWWGRCSRHTSVYGLTMSPSCWRPGSTATMFPLNNVRNFQWRSETDYTPQWEPHIRPGSSAQRRLGAFLLDGAAHRPHPGVVRLRWR